MYIEIYDITTNDLIYKVVIKHNIIQKILVAHCDSDASKYFYVGSYRLTCLEIALSNTEKRGYNGISF